MLIIDELLAIYALTNFPVKIVSSIRKATIVAMMFADTALSIPLDHYYNSFNTSDVILTTTNLRHTITMILMRALSIHSSNIWQ